MKVKYSPYSLTISITNRSSSYDSFNFSVKLKSLGDDGGAKLKLRGRLAVGIFVLIQYSSGLLSSIVPSINLVKSLRVSIVLSK